MNILIVGGAGYLGSKLIKEFTSRGLDVSVVDNLMYNQGPLVSETLTDICCDFHKIDCMDFECEQLLKKADVIYWLPAYVGGPICDAKPEEAQRINLQSVGWAVNKLSKQQRFIFPCSSSGYGSANIMCTENTPMNSISKYGLSKECGEKIALSHQRTTSLRLATVWGFSPRQRLDLIVNDLFFKALKYKKLSLYQGDFKRSYVHINDVVDIFYKLSLDSRTDGNIYNVGSDNCSKTDLVNHIVKLIPECEISYTDEEDYDKRSYFLDCTKIEKLGYKFQYNLSNDLYKLIKNFDLIDLENAKSMRNI